MGTLVAGIGFAKVATLVAVAAGTKEPLLVGLTRDLPTPTATRLARVTTPVIFAAIDAHVAVAVAAVVVAVEPAAMLASTARFNRARSPSGNAGPPLPRAMSS